MLLVFAHTHKILHWSENFTIYIFHYTKNTLVNMEYHHDKLELFKKYLNQSSFY